MSTAVGTWKAALLAAALVAFVKPATASPPLFDAEQILPAGESGPETLFYRPLAVDGNTLAVAGSIGSPSPISVFVRQGGEWVFQAEIPLATVSALAISGNTLVAGGVPPPGHLGLGPGEVHVYVRNGSTWTEQTVIHIPSDLVSNDTSFVTFGNAVGISGNTLVVGASGDSASGGFSGAAFVYERKNGVWTERAKLTDPEAGADQALGFSVAIDRDRIIVGAPGSGTGGQFADIFVRRGSTWTREAKLLPEDASGGRFGWSVDIDGVDAVVGAPFSDEAFAFRKSCRSWQLEATLTGHDTQPGDRFGNSVAIDGNTIVAAAPTADFQGTDSGAAYVFGRRAKDWSELQKLIGSDTDANDLYGSSVDISGKTVVITSARDQTYVYTKGKTHGCDGW